MLRRLSISQPGTSGPPDQYLHTERTLDEAYYPGLSRRVLDARFGDQVVTRAFKLSLDDRETSEFPDPTTRPQQWKWNIDDTYGNAPILMVSQLWIWRFDRYIISAYSSDGRPLTFVERRQESYMDRLKNETIDEDSPKRQIGLVIVDCIEQFGRHGKYPPALQILEAGVDRIYTDVKKYSNGATEPKIQIEREFMVRIFELQGELAMIQDKLRQQKEVLTQILDDPPKDFVLPSQREAGSDYEPWDLVVGSMTTLDKYYYLTEKISADAARIENNIQNELNLKRTFAAMDDARTSLSLGIAVIGFTVITIIFAPLAFVTALFALPLDAFERKKIKFSNDAQEEGTDDYTTSYLGKWFGMSLQTI